MIAKHFNTSIKTKKNKKQNLKYYNKKITCESLLDSAIIIHFMNKGRSENALNLIILQNHQRAKNKAKFFFPTWFQRTSTFRKIKKKKYIKYVK